MLTFLDGLLALPFSLALHPIVTRFLRGGLYLEVMKLKSSPLHFSIILGVLAIVGVTVIGVADGAHAFADVRTESLRHLLISTGDVGP